VHLYKEIGVFVIYIICNVTWLLPVCFEIQKYFLLFAKNCIKITFFVTIKIVLYLKTGSYHVTNDKRIGLHSDRHNDIRYYGHLSSSMPHLFCQEVFSYYQLNTSNLICNIVNLCNLHYKLQQCNFYSIFNTIKYSKSSKKVIYLLQFSFTL